MPSDAVLVRRARGGDRAAFAELVERHYATLVACCRRMVGDSAHDAAQDAVLTALLSLDRLRDDERFGAWLVGIGLNTCRALLRDRALRGDCPPQSPPLKGAVPLSGADSWGQSPFEAVAAAEVAGLVRAAVAELPRGQREAVTLFYLAGLTHAEAAEHLGIPPGAVKTRLHKARTSLRVRLEPLRRERHMPVEMQVTDVRRAGERHILMLEGGGRDLKIWVGGAEAAWIAVLLEQVELPRPGTHQLTLALLEATGGSVREVRISRLAETIFYAEVVLTDGKAVDARPSDAIPLALLTGAPLLVEPEVLDGAVSAPREWIEEAEASTVDRRVLADEVLQRVSRP
jgi:RNA polymerase sigma factor (sigma-70 family)